MWLVAVLTRFEALQTFLSSGERESVKSALWKKWKLEGDKIDELTSTAGSEADEALKVLESSVANLRFFARGKRGVLYAGELRSNDKPVVAKLAAGATAAGSVTLEARWLRVVNRMGIGARLVDAGAGWFLCERLDGQNVVEFLGESDEVATPANAMWVVREMLCQCFALDLMGVNKEEMTHPHRHIIVHRSTQQQQGPVRWRCTFFLSSPRMVALLASKHVKVDVPKLRQCTKRYKQDISTQPFGDIMRVFGL
ncbi:hypothetical protein PHYSODRAFT_528234 [Phytophthora sojae]|uniref:Fungal-type protein kinase domain-containing protein n=1 Tax=Phytophthora sojae (strain P6497) TaxID=1094619 RepID=G5AB22_PHYSP|nr:hypothetical protein PHYSODRAFT_528234 [Phytophthora sojae]EGZ07801.1 hypothetical protein PHYSODRAFT_528234 [Phytophthora sojae]|eukprot:XP_009537367.1 hypothetical protein PHYSODRAFT_528234 [Phytophthora sojae]